MESSCFRLNKGRIWLISLTLEKICLGSLASALGSNPCSVRWVGERSWVRKENCLPWISEILSCFYAFWRTQEFKDSWNIPTTKIIDWISLCYRKFTVSLFLPFQLLFSDGLPYAHKTEVPTFWKSPFG